MSKIWNYRIGLVAILLSHSLDGKAQQMVAPVRTIEPLKASSTEEAIKWTYTFKKTGSTSGVVRFVAQIQQGYRLYSLHTPDGGVRKTTFTFQRNNSYGLIGALTEPKPQVGREKRYQADVWYFENTVTFEQQIKWKVLPKYINGKIDFMVGNGIEYLPKEQIFSVPIK